MRNFALLVLVVAFSFVLVACGGGNNATTGNGGGNAASCGGGCGGGDEADAYALYKKEGRSWLLKMTAGGQVSYQKYEVVKVSDTEATYKMTMLDAEKKPNEFVPPSENVIKFEAPKAACGGGTAEAKEPKKEKVKVEAGEFDCVSYDDGKTWMAEKFPGLIVKSEMMELVEFNE